MLLSLKGGIISGTSMTLSVKKHMINTATYNILYRGSEGSSHYYHNMEKLRLPEPVKNNCWGRGGGEHKVVTGGNG